MTIQFPRQPVMPWGRYAGATLDRLPDSELLRLLALDRRPPLPEWLAEMLDGEWGRRSFQRKKAA